MTKIEIEYDRQFAGFPTTFVSMEMPDGTKYYAHTHMMNGGHEIGKYEEVSFSKEDKCGNKEVIFRRYLKGHFFVVDGDRDFLSTKIGERLIHYLLTEPGEFKCTIRKYAPRGYGYKVANIEEEENYGYSC